MRNSVDKDVVRNHPDKTGMCRINRVLCESNKFNEVIGDVEFLLVKTALVVFQQIEDERNFVHHAEVGVRRVGHDNREAFGAFDGVDGGGLVAECREKFGELLLLKARRWFEGVGEVDVSAALELQQVVGLAETCVDFGAFQRELHVGDGVWRHHEFVTVKTRQQRGGGVGVPVILELGSVQRSVPDNGHPPKAVLLPLGLEVLEDDLDGFDKESTGASRNVQDLNEEFLGREIDFLAFGFVLLRDADLGELKIGIRFQHFAPGDGGGEAVLDAEFFLQEFVGAADDVGDDGLRGVEDAALDSLLPVVSVEEVLVEMDDRVFAARAVPEV